MILVTGAQGFIGRKLMELVPGAVGVTSLRTMSEDDIKRVIEESGCDTIVHTAGISDIAICAKDPEGAYKANVLLPVTLAKLTGGRKLISFSSDQVYSGSELEGPYTEDMVCPDNLYSKYKYEMEQRMLDIDPDSVMLRSAWMFDYYEYRDNYFTNVVNAGRRIAFPKKQYRGLTYAKEVAYNMPNVAKLPGGAYNFGSETDKTMYELTVGLMEKLGKGTVVEDSGERHNLWMDCSKARSFGVVFSSVEDGLEKCARDYGFIK